MNIIGVYISKTKAYTDACINELNNLGYQAASIDFNEYTYDTPITNFPVFLIVKNNKASYALVGKYPIEKIIQWANESGVPCN